MENIFGKMRLYDLFARTMTGILVILFSDLFGITNFIDTGIPIWAIIVLGYFCGLLLEELSWIYEKFAKIRKRIESKVCSDYPKYDFEKCKAALMAHDKETIADEPLAHIVMSTSFQIAFFIFLIVELLTVIWFKNLIENHLVNPFMDSILLVVLICIFRCRANHYCRYRTAKIFDFCISKKYEDIEKVIS